MSVPAPPQGTRAAGRRLWRSVLASFDLEGHELALLREAVRTVDLLDDLEAAIQQYGPTIDSPQGMKANPAAVEARQQRIALARLLVALRVPAGEETGPAQGRTQRRGGIRGVYQGGVA